MNYFTLTISTTGQCDEHKQLWGKQVKISKILMRSNATALCVMSWLLSSPSVATYFRKYLYWTPNASEFRNRILQEKWDYIMYIVRVEMKHCVEHDQPRQWPRHNASCIHRSDWALSQFIILDFISAYITLNYLLGYSTVLYLWLYTDFYNIT